MANDNYDDDVKENSVRDNSDDISEYSYNNTFDSNIPPRKKQKKIWPYVCLVLLFFVTAAIAGAYFAGGGLTGSKKTAEKKQKAEIKEERLITAKDKAMIMIMGVDEREGDVGRSDTLMVAAIDPKSNKASLLSIPRDTRVKIRNRGYDKINAAYAYGGQKLAQSTVENFIGVDIDHYVIVNVRSFVKIIDAIGGVDINVEKRMYYEDPWDDDGGLYIDFQPGLQHMDGKTAVTYVRYRDEEGDIGRVRRQQKFMQACMDKVTSPAIIPKIPAVAKEIFSSIQTDMSLRQIIEFAGTLKEARQNGLKTDVVPGKGMYIDDICYWIPDLADMRHIIADTLDVTLSSSMRSSLEREARDYEESIPDRATEAPDDDPYIGRPVQAPPTRRYTERVAEPPEERVAREPERTETPAVTEPVRDAAPERSSSFTPSEPESKPAESPNASRRTAPTRDEDNTERVTAPERNAEPAPMPSRTSKEL